MSGELSLNITLDRPNIPAKNEAQKAYLLIEAVPTGQTPASPQPINLNLVLDCSANLAGPALTSLQAAIKGALAKFQPDDLISLVAYQEATEVIVPLQPTSNQSAVLTALQKLQPQGEARLSAGLRAGLGEVQAVLNPDKISRVLIITTGLSASDQAAAQKVAERARILGVPMNLIGLDLPNVHLDPTALRTIALRAGGEWEIVKPAGLAQAIGQVVTAMQNTAVTNAHLTLRLTTEAELQTVWRVVPVVGQLQHHAINERNLQAFLGDIQYQVGESLLLELMVLPHTEAGLSRFAQIDIAYDVPAHNLTAQKISGEASLTYVTGSAAASSADPRVTEMVKRLAAA
jgi:Ca-activated chloride channel family protein